MKAIGTKKTAAKPKRVTLESLVKKGLEIKNRELQKAEIFVESLGGIVVVEELPYQVINEALELDETDEMMIYESVIEPNLKDKSLQDSLGCESPDDIVRILLKPGEVAALSKEIIKLSGYGSNSVRKVKDDLKN